MDLPSVSKGSLLFVSLPYGVTDFLLINLSWTRRLVKSEHDPFVLRL